MQSPWRNTSLSELGERDAPTPSSGVKSLADRLERSALSRRSSPSRRDAASPFRLSPTGLGSATPQDEGRQVKLSGLVSAVDSERDLRALYARECEAAPGNLVVEAAPGLPPLSVRTEPQHVVVEVPRSGLGPLDELRVALVADGAQVEDGRTGRLTLHTGASALYDITLPRWVDASTYLSWLRGQVLMVRLKKRQHDVHFRAYKTTPMLFQNMSDLTQRLYHAASSLNKQPVRRPA